MRRWFLLRRALVYRKTIRQLKRDKAQLQGAVDRLEHQLRLARLEERSLKQKLTIKDGQK